MGGLFPGRAAPSHTLPAGGLFPGRAAPSQTLPAGRLFPGRAAPSQTLPWAGCFLGGLHPPKPSRGRVVSWEGCALPHPPVGGLFPGRAAPSHTLPWAGCFLGGLRPPTPCRWGGLAAPTGGGMGKPGFPVCSPQEPGSPVTAVMGLKLCVRIVTKLPRGDGGLDRAHFRGARVRATLE